MEYCRVCNRLHEPNQPCPHRIASSYVGDTQIPLTDADKAWMKNHSINILEIVEETIANLLP